MRVHPRAKKLHHEVSEKEKKLTDRDSQYLLQSLQMAEKSEHQISEIHEESKDSLVHGVITKMSNIKESSTTPK